MAVSTPTHFPVRTLLEKVDPGGQLAPCGLQHLVLGSEAIATVTETVERLLGSDARRAARSPATVVLLVDRTTILRRGEDLKDLVQSQLEERFVVRRTVLDDGQPELHVVDEVLEAASHATAGADAVVAIGGGTISDIAKIAAVRAGADDRPVLVSVQTAASVDGYTDDVSVVLRGGVKRTVPSRWPDAVVADAETIAEAPEAMNRAGFGEMTSMLVAPADWRLAALVGTDSSFHPGAIRLLGEVGSELGSWAAGVKHAEPAAVAALTKALALRGVATGVAGTTAVLSGVEHLISHMLDQYHSEHHLPMGLHGAQVGAASVVAAAAWELLFDRLSERGAPRVREEQLDLGRAREEVDRAFAFVDPTGRVASECWRDYSTKLARVTALRSGIDQLLAGWAEHQSELRTLVRPSVAIATGLRAAGAAATFAELEPSVKPELARWAVANCALMRNRFTVVDLLSLLGWWGEADLDEVLERAAYAVSAADEGS